jgi:uncharacterized protein (DUF58 family)
MVLESGLLAYAMYVLLGLLLLSRYLARKWIADLEATRRCERISAEIGDRVKVSLAIRNRGWLPIPWVLLEDLLPEGSLAVEAPRLRIKGKRLEMRMFRPYQKTVLEYRIRPLMRGYYQLGPLVMETGDVFGLHRRNRVATTPTYLLVYPKVVPLQGYDLASRRPIGEVQISHRLFEDPTRTSGVRQYQVGDPLSRVHWRATARTGVLHSKVYEPSTLSGATILLDFHEAGYPKRGEPARSNLAVTAAVSLACAVHEMGQQIGLITNGRDAAERIRLMPSQTEYETRQAVRDRVAMEKHNERLCPLIVDTRTGVEQFERIRETLARLELTDGMSIAGLVHEVAGRLPRHATVVALLPVVSVETALTLGSLRRQGYAVTAILVLPDAADAEEAVSRLMAQGLFDIRTLQNEADLPTLCQRQLERSSPYGLAVSY